MNMKPPPPSTLSKEFSRVWVGWCMIGDREVAREAAAKGIYISLALQFIATRKEWDYSDVERWFRSEILAWVYQLLEQKQIFKASHILSNIGIDSSEQLSSILLETTNKNMRDYIAEHLLKSGKLETSLLNSWRFIFAIEKYNSLTFNKIWDDISHISIQKIDNKTAEWKSNIATVLFFNTFDFNLESFLSAECAWDNLLTNENMEILKIWINVYFSKDLKYEYNISLNADIYQKLKNIFLLWEITETMINQLKTKSYSETIKDFVLNELSHFGIFTIDEKSDISLILSRFSKTQNIQNIFNILEEPTASFNIQEFYEKLNIFCVKHELYEVLSVCSSEYKLPSSIVQNINSKQLSLWLKKKESTDEPITEDTIRKNIIIAMNYFADDINSYLENIPIILLGIIIFTKDTLLNDIISNKTSLSVDNITMQSEEIIKYLNALPVFRNILQKFMSNSQDNINLYKLLNKYTKINPVFEFRNKEIEIPHFGNNELCKKYGYAENINYLYYVKQNRPSKAAKLFLLEQFQKYGKVNENDLNDAQENIFQLVYRKGTKLNIMSSCISFLEMIGKTTDDLRVIINTIEAINSEKNYTSDDIERLFSNIEENSKEILNSLEKIILEKHDLSLLKDNFINIVKNYELVVSFAKINNLELPTKLLSHCTENNLWLQFLIFIQIYNYPLDQILNLTTNFKNKDIMEHIYHAISNDIELNFDKNIVPSTLSTSITSWDFETAANDHLFEFNTRSNLLKILIKCHKSGDPPTALLQASQTFKTPVLAILATCYEPDSVVTNWLTWLSISTNIEIDIIDNYSVSPNAVSQLLENVLQKGHSRTLLESFEIFLPDNPLRTLAEFLHNCVLLNFESSIQHLNSFEKFVSQLNYNTAVISNDFEYTFLYNSYWLINTGLKLIFSTLGYCFQSKFHQITFLNILCSAIFTKNVPVDCPNFCAISKLLQSLSSNVILNLSIFLNPELRRYEIVKCIELLLGKKQFSDALELAKFENICKEYVLNEEWSYKFQETNFNFWSDCEKAFESAEILPSAAAQFYVHCSTSLTECSDKYKAIKLAYKWLKQSDYSDRFVENVEQEIWSNYFALDDATLKGSCYDKHETNYLLSEILERSKAESRFDNSLNQEQIRHLEETIGKILESGDIIEAVRLNKMFNFKSAEISILMTCYELAEGKLKPYEISAEQRLLFLNRHMNLKSFPHRRRTVKSARTSSFSSVSCESPSQTVQPISENKETSLYDTLSLLETMTDRLQHGSNIASRILMCYRISINTNKTYQEIVKHTDSVSLLKSALENNCKNKIEVVHDIFIIYQWDKVQVTDFIFNELQVAINQSIDLNWEYLIMWDLDLDLQFHLVLQLCSESNSILGKKLLSVTNLIQVSQMNSKINIDVKQINIIVELLVRAHDCFIAYCNMEGIASVLRKAQTVTSILLNLKNWKLMVRLLTGIARYTEMNYIFQILKENDQFEYLLKRNYRKNNGLKMALLKFLKKQCPKNQDLYRMVALHFTLFSEVAELWENEAIEMINNLIEIAKLESQNQGRNVDNDIILFMNNDSTILCLHKAMTNYTHASEYHLLGEKLLCAMRSAKLAELLALQISMLKSLPNNATNKCVLKANPNQILELLSTELTFPQSKILIESYNYQVDWGLVLFNQCIINSKLDYLEEFLALKPLTNTLAQEITRRFLIDKNITQMSVISMKEILKKLNSVHMKYRLASELGFTDVIETILSGSQLAYLKDTVWKKGYKQM